MNFLEVLTFLDRMSIEQRGRRLDRIEREILEISWENKPYKDIKICQEQTAKNKARLLWKHLSKILSTTVKKENVREILESLNMLGMGLRSSNTTTLSTAEIYLSNRRSIELFQLRQWIEVDRHKLIFIYGMKGIGKSYVAQKIAEILSANLDYLVWISIERPTPLIDVLSIIIRRIGAGRSSKISNDLSTAIDKTIGYLQKNRCLLILENADAVLGNRQQTTEEADRLIEEYRMFFDRLNSIEHNSCCLTILEEKILNLDTNDRQLEIQGLDWQSCQKILAKDELKGTSSEWEILVEKYYGNLQYLKSIAPTIKNVFGGNIRNFLDANILVYDRIEGAIADLMANLSEQEMLVIVCLADRSQDMTLERLKDILSENIEYQKLVKILDKLTGRHLVKLDGDSPGERLRQRFVLSDLVAEYVTDRYLD
jgi:SpoVK/Ycf46/Vps4 family AAA+-type ATPase